MRGSQTNGFWGSFWLSPLDIVHPVRPLATPLGKESRDIALNSHFVTLFNLPVDGQLVNLFARRTCSLKKCIPTDERYLNY